MKSPGIFVLTKREQRAVIVIVIALVALAMAKHYRDERRQIIPTISTPTEPSVMPPSTSTEEETAEGGD